MILPLRSAPPSPEETSDNALFGPHATWRGVTVVSDKSGVSISFSMNDGSVQRLRLGAADARHLARALQNICDPNFDPRELQKDLSLRRITEVEEVGESGIRQPTSTRTALHPVSEPDVPASPSPKQNADN